MNRKQGLVPIGEVFGGRAAESDPRSLAPGTPPLHPGRSGEPVGDGPRRGPKFSICCGSLSRLPGPRWLVA